MEMVNEAGRSDENKRFPEKMWGGGGVSVFSVEFEFLFWLQRLMTVIET